MMANGLRYSANWHINENIELSHVLFDLPLSDMPTAFICHCDAAAQNFIQFLPLMGSKYQMIFL